MKFLNIHISFVKHYKGNIDLIEAMNLAEYLTNKAKQMRQNNVQKNL